MKFQENIQEQFIKAGWYENRDVSSLYENSNILRYENFPSLLKEFLSEYGNLEVEYCKSRQSQVRNLLQISLDYAGFEDDEDYDENFDISGILFYPFAYFFPDCYMVACDKNGKVYLLGEEIFLISKDLKSGIQNLLLDDYSQGYLAFDPKKNYRFLRKNIRDGISKLKYIYHINTYNIFKNLC
ncbi:SUKH-3 domain-containing protein [Chryseobacterium hagamense]|nr:SUKH-3 domain-containing protein [Chryseobacterium hagamense]